MQSRHPRERGQTRAAAVNQRFKRRGVPHDEPWSGPGGELRGVSADALPGTALQHPDIRESRRSIESLSVLVAAHLFIVANIDGHGASTVHTNIDRTGHGRRVLFGALLQVGDPFGLRKPPARRFDVDEVWGPDPLENRSIFLQHGLGPVR